MAIPGGMVDKKEKVTETLQREFQEETLNFPNIDERAKHSLLATVKDVFENGGIRIYCGYVDDPRFVQNESHSKSIFSSSLFRNTDNSWMETTGRLDFCTKY